MQKIWTADLNTLIDLDFTEEDLLLFLDMVGN